jgi:hypothetical protein
MAPHPGISVFKSLTPNLNIFKATLTLFALYLIGLVFIYLTEIKTSERESLFVCGIPNVECDELGNKLLLYKYMVDFCAVHFIPFVLMIIKCVHLIILWKRFSKSSSVLRRFKKSNHFIKRVILFPMIFSFFILPIYFVVFYGYVFFSHFSKQLETSSAHLIQSHKIKVWYSVAFHLNMLHNSVSFLIGLLYDRNLRTKTLHLLKKRSFVINKPTYSTVSEYLSTLV